MKVQLKAGSAIPAGVSLLAIPCYQENGSAAVDSAWKDAARLVAPLLRSGDFSGKLDASKVYYPEKGKRVPERVLLIGLGPKADVTGEAIRRYAGAAAAGARGVDGGAALVLLPSEGKAPRAGNARGTDLHVSERVQALAEGIECGSYIFESYKSVSRNGTRRGAKSLEIRIENTRDLSAAKRALARGTEVGRGINLCREVGNLPGNDLGPAEFAERARREGRAAGLKVKILDDKQIRKEKMGALLGVAAGSARPARLIVLEYKPRGRARGKPLVLVGKAITFDSGGISIKPADGMQDMKFDMCGGGAVLGAMSAIARLKPKRPVVGIIASAENMPGGGAMRPGDILRSAAGLTIEIVNTDAEGRLVLADALHYAKRYKPSLVIDLATLTGACVVALGTVNVGLFSRDRELAEMIRRTAAEVGERFWPLPLDDAYHELIKSDVADIKNSGGRFAGAVSAAAFLSRFTEDFPWAHLDIAGTAWTDKESGYLTKGATGVGVRTLIRLAENGA